MNVGIFCFDSIEYLFSSYCGNELVLRGPSEFGRWRNRKQEKHSFRTITDPPIPRNLLPKKLLYTVLMEAVHSGFASCISTQNGKNGKNPFTIVNIGFKFR